MKILKELRNGDIYLQKIDELPEGLEKVDTDIIEAGEASGHHHRLRGVSNLYKNSSGEVAVVEIVKSDVTAVVHEEHNPIPNIEGYYEVIRQRQWNPYEAAAERVID